MSFIALCDQSNVIGIRWSNLTLQSQCAFGPNNSAGRRHQSAMAQPGMNVALPDYAQRAQSRAQQQIFQKMAQEKALLQAAEVIEKQIDQRLEQLDQLGEEDLHAIRQRRLQEMREQQELRQKWLRQGHGQYQEIPDQEAWFRELKQSERVVCHFYRGTTWRCQIVDKHLERLAREHPETRFVKIDAEKCFYLVDKLRITVMPTIVLAKDNHVEDRIEGFDSLGGRDDFSTTVMARRIARKGIIMLDPDKEYDNAVGAGGQRHYNASNPQGLAIYQNADLTWTDSEDEGSDKDE